MKQTWNVSWNEIPRETWDMLHAQAGAAYQQDWAYGEVLTQTGAKIFRAVVSDGQGIPVAMAQLSAKPFAIIGHFALATYGPVWLKDVSAHEKAQCYRAIKSSLPLSFPKLCAFTPDEVWDEAAGLKNMKRVMTGDATIKIDLTQSEEDLRKGMDQKWRNRLVSAEKSALKFVVGGTKPAQYNWLLNLEENQREKRGYRAMPASMTLNWQTQKAAAKNADKNAGISVFRADLGKDCEGAMLVLEHGSHATYHIGWSSDVGRKLGAHNLCLWNACLKLKERGFRQLDLGGVNTQSGAGIARFKIGTGGQVFQRAGAFV